MAKASKSDLWYYATNGQKNGPVSLAQLKSLAATGVVAAHDLVWNEGMAGWAQLATVAALRDQQRGPPPIAGPAIPPPPNAILASTSMNSTAGGSGQPLANKGVNPLVALAASFFCLPLGHLILGQTRKGLLLTLASVVGLCLCILPGALISWMAIFDSYLVAQAIRDGKQVFENEYKVELLAKIMGFFDKSAMYRG